MGVTCSSYDEEKARVKGIEDKANSSDAESLIQMGDYYQFGYQYNHWFYIDDRMIVARNVGKAIECYEKAKYMGHQLASERLSSIKYDDHDGNAKKTRVRDCDWLY